MWVWVWVVWVLWCLIVLDFVWGWFGWFGWVLKLGLFIALFCRVVVVCLFILMIVWVGLGLICCGLGALEVTVLVVCCVWLSLHVVLMVITRCFALLG